MIGNALAMSHRFRLAVYLGAALLAISSATLRPAVACTTAVISGRATADGRPLLWKNRDFTRIKNEVIYVDDGKFAVTALANAGSRSAVWMGVNSAGLCIENSVTKDLGYPEDVKGVGNGGFMLLALKTCATVQDVKRLLEETDAQGRSTRANFGVIDAQGGAALFEASRAAHVMFDANDPEVAPEGIIVRSNFSMTGQSFGTEPTPEQLADLYSGERYLRALHLIGDRAGKLDAKYLLRHCARDLADEHCQGLCGTVNGPAGPLPEFIATKNTISRTTSVSFAVFHGVRKGEDPRLTTMWLGLGDPKFSLVVPCWTAIGKLAPELCGDEGAPLCLAAIALREQFYSKEHDGIRTDGLDALWQELWSIEDELVQRVGAQLERWRTSGIDPRSMAAIHIAAAEQAHATVKHQLETSRSPAAR